MILLTLWIQRNVSELLDPAALQIASSRVGSESIVVSQFSKGQGVIRSYIWFGVKSKQFNEARRQGCRKGQGEKFRRQLKNSEGS